MKKRNGKVPVCLMHPFDPRGTTVGGFFTYIRDFIAFHPEDMDLLLIGVDGVGDLRIGETSRLTLKGRSFDFLPLYFDDDSKTQHYKRNIFRSFTFRFARHAMANFFSLRRLLKAGGYSIELRRPEFAFLPYLWRIPFIQMHHDGAEPDKSMTSSWSTLWTLRKMVEGFALATCVKFYCVSRPLLERIAREHPANAGKLDVLTTWADPQVFKPQPLDPSGPLKIVFAGRMDAFKAPNTMFQVIKRVKDLTGDVQFHYIGDGDTDVFPAFAEIRDIAVKHGRKSAAEIVDIFKMCHMGILTSEFEGMPRFVLECLSSGRPVCALHLPQLEDVIKDGKSGFLVAREGDYVGQLAGKFIEMMSLVRSGAVTPDSVAQVVESIRPQKLLEKIFQDHRGLHNV